MVSRLPTSASMLARRLGWPGWAALLLLGWAAWAQWIAVPESERAAADLRERRFADAARAPSAPVAAPADVLAGLRAGLPEDKDSNATLAGLLERARARGLVIDAVQFQTEAGRLPGVRRHRASLPLAGRYDVLRAWIAQTLHDEPAITLDVIDLKRKDVTTDQLDAHVVLSLWTREPPPAGARATEVAHAR
jgi:hypothetical protein